MAIIGFRVSNDGSRVRKFAMLECRNRLQRDSAALGTMRGSPEKKHGFYFLRILRKKADLNKSRRVPKNVPDGYGIPNKFKAKGRLPLFLSFFSPSFVRTGIFHQFLLSGSQWPFFFLYVLFSSVRFELRGHPKLFLFVFLQGWILLSLYLFGCDRLDLYWLQSQSSLGSPAQNRKTT